MIRDSSESYGLVTRTIHWLSAVIIIALFASGLYMVELDYYDKLYHTLPYYHKSVGILLAIVILLRFAWRFVNPKPKPEITVKKWEHLVATIVQWGMMLLILLVVVLGYLISTAAGDSISVFGWFDLPAVAVPIENQADVAGKWHYYAACLLIALATVHTLAAIKHHFIDKDRTLMRMLTGR